MNFTFKLARRLALSHLVGITALGFLAGSCAPGQPLEGGLEPPPDDVLAIHLVPDSVTLNPTEFVDFSAIAEINGGGSGRVVVEWEAAGGTITADGRYTAGSTAGTYKVKGRYRNGKADSSTVAINSSGPGPVLTGINVTPSTAALLPSATQPFSAIGVMSNGSSSAVTVDWSTTGGTIDGSGLYTAPANAGTYLVVATQQGGSFADTAQVSVTVPPPTLTAVVLTPATAALQFAQTRQFSAVGQLSDGSSTSIAVTWTATGGTINSGGLYTAGNTAGTFRVIARSANGLADTSAVTITAPTITGISLTPATVSLQSGQTQQFSVSATLSNGGTQTNPPVTWTATGGAMNTTGLYTAGATAGGFRVIASSSNGRTDTSAVTITTPTITAITVTPATATLSGGQTLQFAISATLSNGATQVNPSVTWTATGGTVTTGGLFTAGATAGNFRVIAASANGRADTSAVTITASTITAISLTPATANLQSAQTQQFSVSATLSNGGTQANPTVTYSVTGGTITPGGLYTAGAAAGSFRVIATAAGGVADTSAITITIPTITAIVVTPASTSVGVGQTQQFTAAATLSSGGTQSNPAVTWSATGGTISASGLYTAGSTTGTFRVIAVQQGGTLADTAAVTLTAPGTGFYANRPANYTKVVSDYAFGEVLPGNDADQPFGTGGWSMIGGSQITRVSDPTAPVSSPYALQWQFDPGAGGTSVGNVYRVISMNTNELYVAFSIWHDPNFEWNTISNKLLYWEDGNIILQSRHNDSYLSLYIGAYDRVYDPNGYQPRQSDFDGKWVNIEYIIKRGNPGLLKVWMNGQLVSNHAVQVPTLSSWSEMSINSTWGGGGTRLRTSYRRIDHVLVATP